MTEWQWQDSREPGQMVDCLNEMKASARKFRLFSCGGCRGIWHLLTSDYSREAVEVAERFVEGLATQEECAAIEEFVDASIATEKNEGVRSAAITASSAVWFDARKNHGNAEGAGYLTIQVIDAMARSPGTGDRCDWQSAEAFTTKLLSDLLHDIFGNPFRPVSINSAWLNPTVTALARVAYDERLMPSGELDSARLTVLSDALEDAGCTEASLLDHLRGPGPHVRG